MTKPGTNKNFNKYFKIFIFLGTLLSIFLGLVNSAVIITEPIGVNSEFQIKKGENTGVLNLNEYNRFTYSLPDSLPIKLQVDAEPDNAIQISQIQVQNIFGHQIFPINIFLKTKLHEILNTAKYFDLDINSQFAKEKTSFWKPIFQCLFAGFILSFIIIILFQVLIISIKGIYLQFNRFLLPKLLIYNDNSVGDTTILYLSIGFLVTTVFLSFVLIFFGINFGDEGFFLLLAKYPQYVKFTCANTQMYEFTRHLYSMVNSSIPLFRACTIILNSISILVLTIGVKSILIGVNGKNFTKLQTFFVFTLLYISSSFQFIHHISPDYNNFSRYIVFLQVGIIGVLIFNLQSLNNKSIAYIFILGFFTGLNLFIKSPEFVASFLLISGLLVFVRKNYFLSLLVLISGVIAAFLFYFTFLQSAKEFYQVFSLGMYYAKLLHSHNVTQILVNNFIDIIEVVILIVIIVAIYKWLSKPFREKYPPKCILFSSIILLLFTSMICILIQSKLINFFAMLTKSLLVVTGLIFYENIKSIKFLDGSKIIIFKKINYFSFILLLFLYIASLGTDMSILYHVIFNVTLLYIIIFLQWELFDSDRTYLMLLLSALIIFSSIIFIKGAIFQNPLYTNLLNQDMKYKIDNSYVYIDKGLFYDLHKIRSILNSCGYQKGDYIAAYDSMQALVFALEGISPVTPIYGISNNDNNTLEGNKFIASLMEMDKMQNLFILTYKNNINILGYNINDGFTKCGEVDVNFYYTPNYKHQHILIYKKSSNPIHN